MATSQSIISLSYFCRSVQFVVLPTSDTTGLVCLAAWMTKLLAHLAQVLAVITPQLRVLATPTPVAATDILSTLEGDVKHLLDARRRESAQQSSVHVSGRLTLRHFPQSSHSPWVAETPPVVKGALSPGANDAAVFQIDLDPSVVRSPARETTLAVHALVPDVISSTIWDRVVIRSDPPALPISKRHHLRVVCACSTTVNNQVNQD